MFSPHHVRLLSSCYPSAPLSAGPDFKPNAQELSRLSYYGSNRPGKLAKIGQELEKRAQADSRRASTHPKSRASLLVTLEILRTLCAECRSDISLFGRYVVVSVDAAMSTMSRDLEVVARSASVFTAYATFTDGKSTAVDEVLSKSYLSILAKFAAMSHWSSKKQADDEARSRSRLIGLAALTAAIASDALFISIELGRSQLAIIVPALLANVQQSSLSVLQQQEIVVEGTEIESPYFVEFQPQRPVAQRRAASIHMHQDGVEGPTMKDVTFSALRAIKNLLERSDGPQVTSFLASLFTTFDANNSWEDLERCRWIALNVTEWTQYQHRYAIPIRLVHKLIEISDSPDTDIVHRTLIVMITAVFSSRTPIANLATSDVISSLIEFIVRRVERNPEDPILPDVVNCVASLATHLYYADQIQDFAEEIIRKLIELQLANIGSDSRSRQEGMRCLVSCLSGLIAVASKHNTSNDAPSRSRSKSPKRPSTGDSNARDIETNGQASRGASVVSTGGRRNLISPETWQETLAILVEAEYGLRADYARTLAMYISSEIPREQPIASSAASLRPRVGGDVTSDDEVMRFLHALHATVYTLAVAPTLGLSATASMVSDGDISNGAPSMSESTSPTSPSAPSTRSETDESLTESTTTVHLNIVDSTPTQSPIFEEPTTPIPQMSPSSSGAKPSIGGSSIHPRSTHRSRTASLALSLIEPNEHHLTQLVTPAPAPATPDDYSHLVAILSSAVQRTPARAVLTGVPMLLMLDKISCAPLADAEDALLRGRRQAMREGIAQIWAVIASTLELSELLELAQQALQSTSSAPVLPTSTSTRPTFSQPAERPSPFPAANGAGSVLPPGPLHPVIDPEAALTALSASPKLRHTTQLDRSVLLKRLATPWTPASALNHSLGKFTSHENASRIDGSPFLKLSPQLMHIDNKSLASLARSTRNVGVGDLREALEGRASARGSVVGFGLNPSMSSIGHHSGSIEGHDGGSPSMSINQMQARIRATAALKEANGEVKDLLNKLGIGKQSGARTRGARTKPAFKSPLLPSPKRGMSEASNTPTVTPTP